MQHQIVSRDKWISARKVLLDKERAMTHELDALRAERRKLPWVKIEKSYVFEGSEGKCTIDDLFGTRSQLAVYHFMLAPDSDQLCKGCSFVADHIDAARQHFEHADLAFSAISRAPIARIEQVKKRMNWAFQWVSSNGSDFNYDFDVSFTKEELATDRAIYNYGTVIHNSEDMFGISIFVKDNAGSIFHTYSTYHRGVEMLMGALMWLDLVPKGRRLRQKLNEIEKSLNDKNFQKASDLGYREVANEFVFLQRTLGGLQGCIHDREKLIQDIVMQTKTAYEDVAPHVEKQMESLKPFKKSEVVDITIGEKSIAKLQELSDISGTKIEYILENIVSKSLKEDALYWQEFEEQKTVKKKKSNDDGSISSENMDDFIEDMKTELNERMNNLY